MLGSIVTVVAALACPLMMVFMMKGMHGTHGDSQHSLHGTSPKRFRSKDEELAHLRLRMNELQAAYERIEQEPSQHRMNDHPPNLQEG